MGAIIGKTTKLLFDRTGNSDPDAELRMFTDDGDFGAKPKISQTGNRSQGKLKSNYPYSIVALMNDGKT